MTICLFILEIKSKHKPIPLSESIFLEKLYFFTFPIGPVLITTQRFGRLRLSPFSSEKLPYTFSSTVRLRCV